MDSKRTVTTYTFKSADNTTFDGRALESVAIAELTAAEERMIGKSAPKGMLTEEMIKASVKQINGKTVSVADGEFDGWWMNLRPFQRSLISVAFAKHNTTTKEEDADFLTTGVSSAV